MLLQLLLLAPDRIDANTGRFKNRHYLKLRLDGNDDYVGIQGDPVLTLTPDTKHRW